LASGACPPATNRPSGRLGAPPRGCCMQQVDLKVSSGCICKRSSASGTRTIRSVRLYPAPNIRRRNAPKDAAALVFGSAVGWLLAVLWWVLLRQIRLEEMHLRKLFGDEYEAYARQTAKLAPGIF
jgi:hypothetical protein